MSEYIENLDSHTVLQGDEILASTPDGSIVAGEHFREMLTDSLDEVPIGHKSDFESGSTVVNIPDSARFKHTAYFGASGYGKPTALLNHATHVTQSGEGLTYIDTRGDTIQYLLERMPEERREDVVVIEPTRADPQGTVGFNFFETFANPGDETYGQEASNLADAFVDLLRGDSVQWGAKMGDLTWTVAFNLIKTDTDYTFVDLHELLSTESGREQLLNEFEGEFTTAEREVLSSEDALALLDPVLRRLQTLVDSPVVSNLLANPSPDITFRGILESRRLVLFDPSSLSTLRELAVGGVVRGLWAGASCRAGSSGERIPHTMLFDELDVVDESSAVDMGEMFSKARSLRLAITVAAQHPDHLTEDTRLSVLGNCGNLFVFNPQDPSAAHLLADAFPDHSANDLLNLGQFKFATRTAENETFWNVSTLPKLPKRLTESEAQELSDESVERYGGPT